MQITLGPVDGFPSGTVVDHIAVTVTAAFLAAPQTQNIPPSQSSLVITGEAAGTYQYSVVGQDAANNALGTPVTGSFTLSAPATITLQLPTAVSVTQTP